MIVSASDITADITFLIAVSVVFMLTFGKTLEAAFVTVGIASVVIQMLTYPAFLSAHVTVLVATVIILMFAVTSPITAIVTFGITVTAVAVICQRSADMAAPIAFVGTVGVVGVTGIFSYEAAQNANGRAVIVIYVVTGDTLVATLVTKCVAGIIVGMIIHSRITPLVTDIAESVTGRVVLVVTNIGIFGVIRLVRNHGNFGKRSIFGIAGYVGYHRFSVRIGLSLFAAPIAIDVVIVVVAVLQGCVSNAAVTANTCRGTGRCYHIGMIASACVDTERDVGQYQ